MVTTRDEVKTPNCDLLSKNRDARDTIMEFLEWVNVEKSISLAAWDLRMHSYLDDPQVPECYGDPNCPLRGAEFHEGRHRDLLTPASERTESLVLEFFGIDERALEQERRALLEWVRAGAQEANRLAGL